MTEATQLARYLLSMVAEDIVTHLKLQKLLYYCQGFHMAAFGKPLFAEEVQAWEWGPVIREVYQEYKEHGDRPIPKEETRTDLQISAEQEALIHDVYREYGQFAAWKLSEMTHVEPPWLKTKRDAAIDLMDMFDYFKTLVVEAPTDVTPEVATSEQMTAVIAEVVEENREAIKILQDR